MRNSGMRTKGLLFVKAAELEADGGKVGVDEQGDGFVGAGEIGAVIVLFVRGQSICHALQHGVRAESRHDDGRELFDVIQTLI